MSKKIHIKRLDSYMLQIFLPLFLMTFAICLFMVLMQFLWKYVSDMVGKGLELGVILEMFWYAALNLIPMALPLSILLASLMVFGNLGEDFELLAIKTSGISLLRTMSPLIVLVTFISIGAFFFQNDAMPNIQTKFYSLLISIRQKSPELEIPEGIFYRGIEGYNIFVQQKDRKTGMMYGVVIYDISKSNVDEMAVIVCDSAKMGMSKDKLSIVLTLYNGQQFQNFEGAGPPGNREFVPYARENFKEKQILIPFDANFNRVDDSTLEGNPGSSYMGKNLSELKSSIDSMQCELDSMNFIDRKTIKNYSYLTYRNAYPEQQKDSVIEKAKKRYIKLLIPTRCLRPKICKPKFLFCKMPMQKPKTTATNFCFVPCRRYLLSVLSTDIGLSGIENSLYPLPALFSFLSAHHWDPLSKKAGLACR